MFQEIGSQLKFLLITASLCCLTIFSVHKAMAEDGVTENKIIIGQSCALKGPAKALGQGVRDGALAYFNHVNAKGGINGKIIQLVTLDDGYEPKACVQIQICLSKKTGYFCCLDMSGRLLQKLFSTS
ncbi:MAG: ABC transporter substrate-binding protein [Desulfobacterales bacterium]|nr:ABC transporter substrate-binding protein [Desulfobacterales bacterium]